jgi:2-dehydro-3-deoxyphosphooctonate aldolase (KDO 8-P synthase)
MNLNPQKTPLIAGPCVIESRDLVQRVAQEMIEQTKDLSFEYIFKASFDKANRTSLKSFRGPGMEEGLKILEDLKTEFRVPVLTDVHLPDQCEPVASVVDVLQIPAFLCRQTDLLVAAGEAAIKHDASVNIKKGQFLAPWDMKNVVEKLEAVGLSKERIFLTERGSSFGYNRLVVDMTSFSVMNSFGVRALFDATHSVQLPGAGPGGQSTGGQRDMVDLLARAAFAAGAEGLFMEVHPEPEKALSDAATCRPLKGVRNALESFEKIYQISKELS